MTKTQTHLILKIELQINGPVLLTDSFSNRKTSEVRRSIYFPESDLFYRRLRPLLIYSLLLYYISTQTKTCKDLWIWTKNEDSWIRDRPPVAPARIRLRHQCLWYWEKVQKKLVWSQSCWDSRLMLSSLAQREREEKERKCRECIFFVCKHHEQRFTLTAYTLYWNALRKKHLLKSTKLSLLSNSNCSLRRTNTRSQRLLCCSSTHKPSLFLEVLFIWCDALLLYVSWLHFFGLRSWWSCRFLVVVLVFWCSLHSSSTWWSSSRGRGFGSRCRFWGSVGRMTSTPPTIPSRGWVTPPSASFLSYWGLQDQKSKTCVRYKVLTLIWVANVHRSLISVYVNCFVITCTKVPVICISVQLENQWF